MENSDAQISQEFNDLTETNGLYSQGDSINEYELEELILSQMRYGKSVNQPDYFAMYFRKALGLETFETIEDNSIYLYLTDENKYMLDEFRTKISRAFDTFYGITIESESINVLYNLYKIFVLQFPLYFALYMKGLSNENNTFIENKKEFTIEYINSLYKEEQETPIIEQVKKLVQYTSESGIFADNFLESISYEEESSLILSLMAEQEGFRISYDDTFFIKKLGKVLQDDVHVGRIAETYINIHKLK